MNLSKVILLNNLKSSLKWMFFFVLYPFVVLSTSYNMGVSFAALLFSYISIIPTLLFIKYARVAREKSIDLNELIARKVEKKLDKNVYEKVIVALKVARKIILAALLLLSIKVLISLFGISNIIMPSLSASLIILLQAYYMSIVVFRIKYEA